MSYSAEEIRAAAARAQLPPQEFERLWRELTREADPARPRFDATHVAYYLGALIVLAAMGWLMTKAWDAFGGASLFGIAIGYAVIFVIVGRRLWPQPALRIPGGLLITLAVGMTPLAVYGLCRWTNFWPQLDPGSYTRFHPMIHASWVFMEIATVLTGLVAIRCYRFPFLTAPIAWALWFLSMDLPEWIMGRSLGGWEERASLTMIFGGLVLIVAYVVDLAHRALDFSFWLYLFGLLAFWGGLTSQHSDSEFSKFIYCVINLGLIALSLVLRRRVFVVFGSLGFFGYLGHLTYRVFEDSVIFPFALTALGLAVIASGVVYQRQRDRLEQLVGAPVRSALRNFIPPRLRDV